MKHPLDKLLCPRSVAIVGASDRPGSNGHAMFSMMRADGYDGAVYPVNPRLSSIENVRCYSSLRALPEVPDHVVIGVNSALVEEVLDEAISIGARSATIFASCQIENDTTPNLRTRIARKALAADMAICGANCMGFYTPKLGLRVASMPSPAGLRRGGIALIVQSGSALSALAHNDRRIGFSLCVSTGMELVTTAADYMDWALCQNDTRVIGLFLETVRDPRRFMDMLECAAARRVPVVVLKVGRTEASAEMALSHTGAIAGSDATFDAVCRRYGVVRVADMDEFAATLALFDSKPIDGKGGFASVHDSGGERELVADLADDIGLSFAPLEPATLRSMSEHLEIGLKAENPLDAYGTHRDVERRYAALLKAMINDPNIALAFFMANPRDGYEYAQKYASSVRQAAAQTGKPMALVSNYALTDDADLALSLAKEGVPLLRGSRNALWAAKHALVYRDFQANAPRVAPEVPQVPETWRLRLQDRKPLTELEGLALLEEFGLNVPKRTSVSSRAELIAACKLLSYPLVLKTAENHAHKSDVGGVALNISSVEQALDVYEDFAVRLGSRAIVMEMAPSGEELALGALWDESFGPIVVISAGGELIELFDDKISALAPFDQTEARRLVSTLKFGKVLKGVRGKTGADLEAVADQVSKFSVMAASLGDRISEIDVNPLVCAAKGVFAVDCLVVSHKV